MRKPDHSLVTNADHEADKIIRQGLSKAFPEHAVLTEESGMQGSPNAEYVWVVDPVDGTKAYAAGIPGYSVMIGLLKEGKPFAGVVVDPLEGHIFEACRGMGAFRTLGKIRTRTRVSARQELTQMPVITSTGFPNALEAQLRPSLPGPWIPAVNSVGIKVGIMVRELADIYINHRWVHYWDSCAPQIILEEAGGSITYWNGQELDYALREGTYEHALPTLATNGRRHRDILAFLKPLS
jgi:3'(2'), 5'-bisphosphate nucleotidase